MISPPDSLLVSVFSRLTKSIGIVTVLLAALSSVLVLRFSGRTSREYRYCLMAIVIWAAISDLNLHYFFAPIVLLPRICLYTDGLLGMAGVSAGNAFVVLLPRSRFKMSFTVKYALVVLVYIYVSLQGLMFWFCIFTKEEIGNFRNEFLIQWPVSLSQSVDCFNDNTTYGVYVVIFSVSLCIIVLSLICSHIFSNLAHHSSMSNSVKKYNRSMTRMLIFQALVPCVFILCPVSMICIQVVLDFESAVFPLLAMAIASLHSLMHSVLMISTSKTYRSALTNFALRIAGRVSSVVTTAEINTHDGHTVFLGKQKATIQPSPRRRGSTARF